MCLASSVSQLMPLKEKKKKKKKKKKAKEILLQTIKKKH